MITALIWLMIIWTGCMIISITCYVCDEDYHGEQWVAFRLFLLF